MFQFGTIKGGDWAIASNTFLPNTPIKFPLRTFFPFDATKNVRLKTIGRSIRNPLFEDVVFYNFHNAEC